jgi:membrane protein
MQNSTIFTARASVSPPVRQHIPFCERFDRTPDCQRSTPLRLATLAYRLAYAAFLDFIRDDGWAIASHIALSTLMSLFPFLIFVTALTGFLFGTDALADQVATLLLDIWPPEVAGPIASEIASVLGDSQRGPLTFGAVLALFFSSSGIESLRIGLNRAYDVTELRPWWHLRLESIVFVVIGAIALTALAFLIVLAPLIFRTALYFAPWLAGIEHTFTFARYSVAIAVLAVALFLMHKWLPYGRRRVAEIVPGIVVTLVLWILTGAAFGRYLAEFSASYVATYAGLASAMVALVFLYWSAGIFMYGAELNQAIRKARLKHAAERK